MQDVAIAAMRNWETLRTAANAKPWLYRLTVRAGAHASPYAWAGRGRESRRRWTLTRRKHGLSEADAKPSKSGGDPLAAFLSSERHAQLRIAMGKLPVKDLEMLLLKHVDDCSYQEIGKRLGVTAGVVQMRLFRARQKLRETLLQQYPEE